MRKFSLWLLANAVNGNDQGERCLSPIAHSAFGLIGYSDSEAIWARGIIVLVKSD